MQEDGPEFRECLAGDFDLDTCKFSFVELKVHNVSPAEMQGLIETVKKWVSSPGSEAHREIGEAVRAVEAAETPREKRQRKALEAKIKEADARDAQPKTYPVQILEYLGKHGASSKSDVQDALSVGGANIEVDGKLKKNREYYRFHEAWSRLSKEGEIRLADPEKPEMGWVLSSETRDEGDS